MSNLYIPEDLFLLVLIRLPVKTLGRFKCVSKSWNLMICSSKFVELHLQHQQYLQQYSSSIKIKPPIRLLCRGKLVAVNYIDVNGRSRERGSTVGIEANMAEYYSTEERIGCVIQGIYNCYESHAEGMSSLLVGSCNGLLCQILINEPCRGDGYECEISLCNPLTKSSWILPKSPLFLNGVRDVVFSGFGYDDVHHTYKIFIASQRAALGDPLFDYEVYCLRSDNWIRVRLDLDFCNDYDIETGFAANFKGVLINASLNWILRSFQNQNKDDCILAFDLRAHKYNLLQYPVDIKGKNYNLMLSGLNGCLLLHEHRCTIHMSFDMWMMKDYGRRDSWMKIRLSISQYPNLVSITPMAVLEDYDGTKIIYHEGRFIVCYDTVTHKIIRFPAPSVDTYREHDHINFLPSLVDPHPMTMTIVD